MASLFDAFVPQASQPSAYQATSGYQQNNGYQPPPSYMTSRMPPASGQPTAMPNGNLQAPAGMQDMYNAYQAGKPAPALTNSATGQPLDKTGQVDESQVDMRSVGQRLGLGSRLGGALDTAALMASMIPQGRTIGEAISNVGGAMHNLPYAELMHAYQMGQPGLERAKEMAGIGLTQAQTQEAQQRGQYYSTEGQYKLQSEMQRMQEDALLRMEGAKQQPGMGIATEDGTGPHGSWKKGDRVYGYTQNKFGGRDQMGRPQINQEFNAMDTKPIMPQDTYGYASMFGGTQGQGGQGGGGFQFDPRHPMSGQLANWYASQHPDATPDQSAAWAENVINTTPSLKNTQNRSQVAQQAKSADEEFKSLQLPEKAPKASEVVSMSPEQRQQYGLDPNPYHDGFIQDPGKVAAFAKDHNQKVAQYKSQYEKLPPDQQTGFQNYLVDQGYNPSTHTFAPQQGPAAGGHDIQYGNWKYHYSGTGDVSDIRNYKPFTKQEMEAK